MKKTVFFIVISALSILLFSGTQFFCQAGTISGRVKDPSGQWLADVEIDAVAVNGVQAGFVAYGITDNDGHFSIIDLPAGTYKLMMVPINFQSTYIAPNWYDNKDCETDGTVVNVPAEGEIVLNDQQLREGGRVTGVLKGSSGPLAGVLVGQWEDRIENYYWYTVTDDAGTYSLNLPVGSWKIIFDPWFVPGNYLYQWYNGVYGPAEAQPVAVAEGATTELIDQQLRIMEMGTISGSVTDSSGTGIPSVNISAKDNVTGINYASTTNDNGEYSVTVPPGDYKVSFNPPADAGNYASEWYQGTNSSTLANVVYVVPGRDTPDINAQLRATSRLGSLDLFVLNQNGSPSNGNLFFDFLLQQNFRNLLRNATLTGPNGFHYDYNLGTDTQNWLSSECRCLFIWNKGFNSFTYGEYTLTLNFFDGVTETYTKTLKQSSIIPVDPQSISVTINSDGSADVSWALPPGNIGKYYQVRVRNADGSVEYFADPQVSLADQTSLHISAQSLRCLERNQPLRWYVRMLDGNPTVYNWGLNSYNVLGNSFILRAYDPGSSQRVTSSTIMSWNGNLAVGFDVRPGSRDDVVAATVTGPNNFSYAFNLIDDFYDVSTEVRFSKGWWKEFAPPFDFGQYTLQVTFGDGHKDTIRKTLTNAPVSGVDSGTMNSTVHKNGVVSFQWQLPSGVNQSYDVKIRSLNNKKEYYNSARLNNQNAVNASYNDLRGLEHAKTYQWFVRAYDPGNNTMQQSNIRTFFYNPFDLEYHSLVVTKVGDGKVTSSLGGIDCGAYCQDTFVKGLPVTLTATADPGFTFMGWSGDCFGTGACTVTMDAAHNVIGVFAVNTPTPAGNGIVVQPVDTETSTTPVQITFDAVTTPGSTCLSVSQTGPPSPAGFQLGNPPVYYDLTSTATYSGPISVCINYAGVSYGDESNLRLFHFENGTWVDRTVSVDTTSKSICASTTSLSPFVVLEKVDLTPPDVTITATPSILWPADGKMVSVTIGGTASDLQSGIASLSFKIEDEYGRVQPMISKFGDVIQLEASRNGNDSDGRIYTISVVATDKAGNQATASTTVVCPHDQRKK